MQSINSYEVYYHPQKIREIGGALENNDIFPLWPYTSTHPPQNSGIPFLWSLCFWNEQDLDNLQLKRNLPVCCKLKILWWILKKCDKVWKENLLFSWLVMATA